MRNQEKPFGLGQKLGLDLGGEREKAKARVTVMNPEVSPRGRIPEWHGGSNRDAHLVRRFGNEIDSRLETNIER